MDNIAVIDEKRERIIEYGDNELYSKRDCTHTDHDIIGFKTSKKYFDLTTSFKTKYNTKYYLLYVLYRTGDSFGYSTGNIEFIGLYEKLDLAKRNEKLILEHYKRVKDDYNAPNRYSIELFSSEKKKFAISCAWVGYFEFLESIEIVEIEKIKSEE